MNCWIAERGDLFRMLLPRKFIGKYISPGANAKPDMYSKNLEKLKILEIFEYTYCTKPELLGLSHHILVVAKKF